MKKIVSAVLVFVMMLSLAGCGISYDDIKGDWTAKTINGMTIDEYAASLGVDPSQATVNVNITEDEALFEQVNGFTPPITSMFFVLSGMSLELSALSVAGLVGAVYVVVRIAGKYLGAYCGAAYGQRERNADQHRYQNAHKERVHFGRAHYKIAKARHDGGYARPRKPRNEQPAHNCDRWRNKNINFCLF